MEFIDVSRFIPDAPKSRMPAFTELADMNPVMLTHDLGIADIKGNKERIQELADSGLALIPVRRTPPPMMGGRAPDGSFPDRFVIEPTNFCNAKCRMCPHVVMTRSKQHMDMGMFRKIIDEMDENGLKELLLLHFGEPLLHPNIFDMIDYVDSKSNLGVVFFSTNGIMLDEDKIHRLLSSRLTYVQISLQAIDKESYARIAPNVPFEKVMANLERLIELKQGLLGKKPFFRLQIVGQPANMHTVDEFLARYGAKCDIISVNKLEYKDSIQFIKSRDVCPGRRTRKSCIKVERLDCFIHAGGAVVMCDHAYNGELTIGDASRKTLREIWNGSERADLIAANKDGSIWDKYPVCRDCDGYDVG